MITSGNIWEEVSDVVRDDSADIMKSIKRSCQLSYYHLWGMLPWEAGRRKLSATLSASASYLLPADMVGIESVYDSANEIQYCPGTQWGKTIRSTWFFLDPVEDALVLLNNLTVESSANKWTGGTWDASYIGEYIRFGKESGINKKGVNNG